MEDMLRVNRDLKSHLYILNEEEEVVYYAMNT